MCFSFNSVRYVQHAGAVLALKKRRKKEEEEEEKKGRPLLHELFLIAVHSHGHGASDPRTRLCYRGRAPIMPHPSLASPVSEERRRRNPAFG